MSKALEPVVVVDDEPGITRQIGMALASSGFTSILTLNDSRDLIPLLGAQPVSVLILDLQMPDVSGTEILDHIRKHLPHLPVIVLTATAEVETAVRCMQLGAMDYLVKPADPEKLIAAVRRAQEVQDLKNEIVHLRRHLLDGDADVDPLQSQFVTMNEKMHNVLRYAEAISRSSFPVLITGESGTGRAYLAQLIHQVSGRTGSFIAIDVEGFDEKELATAIMERLQALIPGEPAGIEDTNRKGTAGDTLCLRNIEELPTGACTRIWRLVHEGLYAPFDSRRSYFSNARIILTSSPDIRERTDQDRFLKTLYYEIRDHQIDLEPLRHRKEDIPYLLDHFLERSAREAGAPKPPIGPDVLPPLLKYDFPGNLSELEHLVHSAFTANPQGPLSASDLLAGDVTSGLSPHALSAATGSSSLFDLFGHFPTVQETVDYLIEEALKATENNKAAAASLLQITRQTINRRLRLKK